MSHLHWILGYIKSRELHGMLQSDKLDNLDRYYIFLFVFKTKTHIPKVKLAGVGFFTHLTHH